MQMAVRAEQDVLFETRLFIIRSLKDGQENVSAALSQMECQTLQFLWGRNVHTSPGTSLAACLRGSDI